MKYILASASPRRRELLKMIGLDFDVTSINFGIFGFLLLAMMVLRPEGLIPSTRRKLELHGDQDIDSDEVWFDEASMYDTRTDEASPM